MTFFGYNYFGVFCHHSPKVGLYSAIAGLSCPSQNNESGWPPNNPASIVWVHPHHHLHQQPSIMQKYHNTQPDSLWETARAMIQAVQEPSKSTYCPNAQRGLWVCLLRSMLVYESKCFRSSSHYYQEQAVLVIHIYEVSLTSLESVIYIIEWERAQ